MSVVVNSSLIYCRRPTEIVVYHFPIFHKRGLRAERLSGCSVVALWLHGSEVFVQITAFMPFLSRFVPM